MTTKQRARVYYEWCKRHGIGDGGVGENTTTPEVADKVAQQLGFADYAEGVDVARDIHIDNCPDL